MPGIHNNPNSESDLDHPLDLDALWNGVIANAPVYHFYYPPYALLVNGQNMLIHHLGGTLFDVLRQYAPRWHQIACEAYIALYSWHGTTNARPLLQSITVMLINQAIDSNVAIDPTWSVENVQIPIGNEWYTTSLGDAGFMDLLKGTVAAAQGVFYTRTLETVRHLLLPFNDGVEHHPGMIPSQVLVTAEQVDYVNSLVVWNPKTGYNLWHDFHTDEDGVTTLRWFDRHSLKNLMDVIHFGVGSPGYLYIQELYANPATGGEEWGPLTAATFHSTTWILAAIHVYLWADVLGNQRFSTTHFTNNRRDAILQKQDKIALLLRQVLRRMVPGLTVEQQELAYQGLHHFMHTNPDLPV